jgi:hypothetical protein
MYTDNEIDKIKGKDQQPVGSCRFPLVHPRHIRISWLLRQAEKLEEIEPGRSFWYIGKDDVLVEGQPNSFTTARLLAGIQQGLIYVLWAHQVQRGEWADNLFTTNATPVAG